MGGDLALSVVSFEQKEVGFGGRIVKPAISAPCGTGPFWICRPRIRHRPNGRCFHSFSGLLPGRRIRQGQLASMARIVMKFGGTSVADIARIRNVARHVKREVDAGHEVAVVVSAMAGKTNELVAWTREASPMHDAREYDAVVASGEQVTAGPAGASRCRTSASMPAPGRAGRSRSGPTMRMARRASSTSTARS